MQLTVQGHGLDIPKRFENHVNGKAARLDRYLPGIEDVRIEVTRQSAKDDAPKSLQLTVRRRRTILRVEERNPDLFAAFDDALDKMYQRIARYKGKRVDAKRNGKPVDTELETAEALPEGVTTPDDEARLVKTKSFTIMPMSIDEAIEQMELIGHDFFVFMHDGDSATKVVYRRKDGGYGLLQPEK